jgi:hypothetical protein
MLQRVRFNRYGMEIETQEGTKIVESFLVRWEILWKVARHEHAGDYLNRGRNGHAAIPDGVFEFPLES